MKHELKIMNAQDHIEITEDDWKQTDIIRDNLQREYAEKCFAPPHFPFIEVAAGFVLGVCLTLIMGGLV